MSMCFSLWEHVIESSQVEVKGPFPAGSNPPARHWPTRQVAADEPLEDVRADRKVFVHRQKEGRSVSSIGLSRQNTGGRFEGGLHGLGGHATRLCHDFGPQ